MLGFFSGRIRRSATVAGGSDTPIELPEHNHDDAVMLVGPDEKIEPKPRPRGPTVGSGRYPDADRELFPAIKKLVDAGRN
jgi:hypothetical protein